MAKKITHSAMVGKAGVALVTLRLSEMGFLFHETGSVEAGTDGFVELCDPSSGAMLSTVFRVQSKATEFGRAWSAETETSFVFPCKERDISDWVASNVPVVLVCCDTKRQLAYWKDVTSYFDDAAKRQRRQVIFDKAADVFDTRAAAALAATAIPKRAGIHIPPPAKKEKLVSNLLEVVDYPKHVWVAPALVTHMRDVEEILRPAGIGVECFLRGSSLFSFRSFGEPAWAEICDIEAAEKLDASEWADSDDPVRQHEFAELLRRALGEKVRENLAYHRKDKLFYFRAPDDLSDVRLPGGRCVFRVYRKKRSDDIRFCRHFGFRAHFLRLDGAWYLEINPQYRFTADGNRPAKFQADNISKLKRMQHNDAVRQELQALAAFLNQPATLLTPAYRLITFGELLRFDVDFGFDETAWRAQEQAAKDDMQLFNAA
jgi:Domain of unknown function (DUF4365)